MITKKRQARKAESPRVHRGSGNVFADLGFSRNEAAELEVKAELARQIHNRIKLMALTQTKAANRLGLSQPDVSKLMNGRHTGYTVDRLISLLNALEMDVEIIIKPNPPRRDHRSGVVRVMPGTSLVQKMENVD
jgi:predicted XRE-type DNA-binding protein